MIIRSLSTKDIVSLRTLQGVLQKLIDRDLIDYPERNAVLKPVGVIIRKRGYFHLDDLSAVLDTLEIDEVIQKAIKGPIVEEIAENMVIEGGDYERADNLRTEYLKKKAI